MRLLPRTLFAVIPLTLSACATTPSGKVDVAAAGQEIRQRVDNLLYRYANNDQAGVIAMLDPQQLTISGSDLTEVIKTPEQLRALMSRDFGQWQAARFDEVRDFDVRTDGTLATAFFVFSFSAGNGPAVPIRLCSTWRKVNGEWLLTQSANAVMAPH